MFGSSIWENIIVHQSDLYRWFSVSISVTVTMSLSLQYLSIHSILAHVPAFAPDIVIVISEG